MRVLFTTRGSSGHLLPLAPFANACRAAGHEVLVAVQEPHQINVERAGLAVAVFDAPPADEWMPLMERFSRLGLAEANDAMIAEYFGRLDTRAALPGLATIADDWQPDAIVRETWEFASTIVAEQRGLPVVRVALGLASLEAVSIELAAPAVDELRVAAGLGADPGGDRLRAMPSFTMMPAALENPAVPPPGPTHRFRTPVPADVPALADWWPGNDDPLVYLTLGSVTGGRHLPYFPALYHAAVEAVAALDVRVLLTIGGDRSVEELGPVPANVHVEQWVAQDTIAAHAAAIVCHGGYGTTVGALAHGVPLVVLPLFSADQWDNAEAVVRAGAGAAMTADRDTRAVMEVPDVRDLAGAVQLVLSDTAYRDAADRIAADIRALPDADAAVGILAAL